MRRRDFLKTSAAAGVAAALPGSLFARSGPEVPVKPLKAPASGPIPVAFVITEGSVLIDFAGPWEVFQDVYVPSRGKGMDDQMPFQLYTVSEKTEPVKISGGLKIVPDYAFASAPAPKVIVIPAQSGGTAAVDWVRRASGGADVTMSVCTGAFLLAATGLLDGKSATTHHSAYKSFAMKYPKIQTKRGVRFVDEGSLATAGGLTSGIDLALHVVERYFGREAATNTAYQLEYQGLGWKDPASNAVYAKAMVSTDAHPLCPVCEMEVDKASAPKSVYAGKTYYFCSEDHKATFDAAPAKWTAA
jgi:transcriptional regulator GlxA family with amidase domain/YHS domain-containing protein